MLNILAFSTLLAGVACSPSPSAPVAPGTNPAVDGASQAVNATSNASVGQGQQQELAQLPRPILVRRFAGNWPE